MTDAPNTDPDIPSRGDLSLQILDHLFEGCQVLDFELRYLYLNHQAAQHARKTPQELLGRRMVDMYPGIDQTEVFQNLLLCLKERKSIKMENTFRYENGDERLFSLRLDPVEQGVFIVSEDITDRRLAEDRLQQSEAMLSRAEQVAGIGNWHWHMGRDEVSWSRGLFRIFGLDPEGGAPPFAQQKDLYHPDDWKILNTAVQRAAEEGRFYVIPTRLRRPDDSYRNCIIRGYPEPDQEGKIERLYGVVQDVTDLLALQEQVEQRHRLESIGSLAGGVAHDFNNILMAQMGFCDQALGELNQPDTLEESILHIRGCAERAATLTRQLLTFSRKQPRQPVVLELDKVVLELEPLLRRLIGEDVDLKVHICGSAGHILADPGQIEQIIMNLVVNSRDAMPEGGRVTIETGRVELDDDYVAEHEGATPGPHALLVISDTGTGMDEETRLRLFDPFFTTKELGRGTGMGMAMVYGIVKQSGGNIWVYSEPGSGTTIKVYLPRVDLGPTRPHRRRPQKTVGGGEQILVVEDDENVANLLATGLRRLGYQVHLADNGEAGLQKIQEEGLRPQLLITDVVMPGMGGGELAGKLQEFLPGLRVLFMSGYTENVIVNQGVLEPGVHFLQKPFNIGDLAGMVRSLLDS